MIKPLNKKLSNIGEISGPIQLDKYQAIESYDKTDSKELSMKVGEIFEVIDKQDNGWWMVTNDDKECGWVPGGFLKNLDDKSEDFPENIQMPKKSEQFIASSDFQGSKGEVSFRMGDKIEVIKKTFDGWWTVRVLSDGSTGLAPSSYLDMSSSGSNRSSNRSSPYRSQSPNNNVIKPNNNVIKPNNNDVIKSLNNDMLKPLNSASRFNNMQRGNRVQSMRNRAPPRKLNKPKISPPVIPPSGEIKLDYYGVQDFDSSMVPNGIDVKIDQKVTVLDKSGGDWWFLSIDGREGWAPASHVQRKKAPGPKKPANIPKPPPMRPNDVTTSLSTPPKIPAKGSNLAPKIPAKASNFPPKIPAKASPP